MNSAKRDTPRSSLSALPPVAPTPTPRRRRPRAEDCERIRTGDLRPLVAAGARSHCLADGTQLALGWVPVRGCWGGNGGLALALACPQCSASVRQLWRPPGQGWGCWRCHGISHRSHRRSGARRGRRKPASWHLERIREEQRRVADLLGLASWPPQRILWRRSDLEQAPRRSGAPRISRDRRDALLLRLDLLESIRFGECLPLLEKVTGDKTAQKDPIRLMAQQARILLSSTDWAVRRPAQDARTTRAR